MPDIHPHLQTCKKKAAHFSCSATQVVVSRRDIPSWIEQEASKSLVQHFLNVPQGTRLVQQGIQLLPVTLETRRCDLLDCDNPWWAASDAQTKGTQIYGKQLSTISQN